MSKASTFVDSLVDVKSRFDSIENEVKDIINKRPVCECGGLGLFEITNEGNLRVARLGAGYEYAKPDDVLRFGKWLVEMFSE